MDQDISYYRIAVPSKNWCMSVLMFMPDAAVQNVWLLNRSTSSHDNEPMDLLICKEIVNIYRVKYSPQQRIHIFSPTDVTLFRSKSNEKEWLPEVNFDDTRHYSLSSLTHYCCSYCGKKLNFTLITSKVIMNM